MSKAPPDSQPYLSPIHFPNFGKTAPVYFFWFKPCIPRCKTNIGLKALSYIGPSLWNNINENLKRSSSLNNFKHSIKEHYFRELKKKKPDQL